MASLLGLPANLIARIRREGLQDTLDVVSRLFLAMRRGTFSKEALTNPVARNELLAQTFPVSAISPGTTYVFCFLGEFGYELFNWQGVVRKFARQLPSSCRIVIAGRKGLQQFYETANEFIDISEFTPYRESVAAGYLALPPDEAKRIESKGWTIFDKELRSAISEFCAENLKATSRARFVFSSHPTLFPGCFFGVDRRYYRAYPKHPGNIYGNWDLLSNNEYQKIQPHLPSRVKIEKQLGFSLDEPFILVQSRKRSSFGPQFGGPVDQEKILSELSKHMRVISMEFFTGRASDSVSVFNSNKAFCYQASSFEDQSCLIAAARRCVFLTEGDFGSHTYLPPFMGKDVHVIAYQEILKQPSAAYRYWNENIFRFGGQMYVHPWEPLVSTEENFSEGIRRMLSCNHET